MRYSARWGVRILSLASNVFGMRYRAETIGVIPKDSTQLPVPYSLNDANNNISSSPLNSFYSTSFVTASNNHKYTIMSQILTILFPTGITAASYRVSVLDNTDPFYYAMSATSTMETNILSEAGVINATYPDFAFRSTNASDDSIELETYNTIPGVEFYLKFKMTSPVIYNGGIGLFSVGTSTVLEWSMPAGTTSGWLTVNGTRLSIDSASSLTWYDRQWEGKPSAWTWFELHLDTGGRALIPISVWVWDNVIDGTGGIASSRDLNGVQSVVPVTTLESGNRTFTSTVSNNTYPLDWTLKLADGTNLLISSMRPDQEIAPQDGASGAAYEGYIEVVGRYKGYTPVIGYGVVEMVI